MSPALTVALFAATVALACLLTATRRARRAAAAQIRPEVLAQVNHEIRTPLNGVIGLTEALIDTDLDETQVQYVRMIRSCGHSLVAAVDDVLDIVESFAQGERPAEVGGSRVSEPVVAPIPPRVLVAEDNHVNQVVAVSMLQKLGYSVAVAENGREALDLCARDRFAAVLMDCQMPQLDGYEATREIRRREAGGPHLPIIAVTALGASGDRDLCLEAGMDDYIRKPLRPADLEATLGRWVGARRS